MSDLRNNLSTQVRRISSNSRTFRAAILTEQKANPIELRRVFKTSNPAPSAKRPKLNLGHPYFPSDAESINPEQQRLSGLPAGFLLRTLSKVSAKIITTPLKLEGAVSTSTSLEVHKHRNLFLDALQKHLADCQWPKADKEAVFEAFKESRPKVRLLDECIVNRFSLLDEIYGLAKTSGWSIQNRAQLTRLFFCDLDLLSDVHTRKAYLQAMGKALPALKKFGYSEIEQLQLLEDLHANAGSDFTTICDLLENCVNSIKCLKLTFPQVRRFFIKLIRLADNTIDTDFALTTSCKYFFSRALPILRRDLSGPEAAEMALFILETLFHNETLDSSFPQQINRFLIRLPAVMTEVFETSWDELTDRKDLLRAHIAGDHYSEPVGITYLEKKYQIELMAGKFFSFNEENLKVIDSILAIARELRPQDLIHVHQLTFSNEFNQCGEARGHINKDFLVRENYGNIILYSFFPNPDSTNPTLQLGDIYTEKQSNNSYSYLNSEDMSHEELLLLFFLHEMGHAIQDEHVAFYTELFPEEEYLPEEIFAEDYSIFLQSEGTEVMKINSNRNLMPHYDDRLAYMQKHFLLYVLS